MTGEAKDGCPNIAEEHRCLSRQLAVSVVSIVLLVLLKPTGSDREPHLCMPSTILPETAGLRIHIQLLVQNFSELS